MHDARRSIVPTLPEWIPPVARELTGLSQASPARAVPFLVEGRQAWVEGVESRPGFRVGIGGRVVASVATSNLESAANVLLFPGVARRDFVGGDGVCVESLLATPTLPLVVGRWRADRGGGPASLIVDLAPPLGRRSEAEGGAGVRPVVARDHSVVSVENEIGVVAVGLAPPPTSLDVRTLDDGTVQAVFEPASSGDVALVLAAGLPMAVDAAFAAAAHTPGHAVRAAVGPEDGLLLHTGVAEVDDGVRWLRSRLAGRIGRRRGGVGREDVRHSSHDDALALGLAAIGVGDRGAAAQLFPGDIRSSGGERPDAATAVLAARFASVFGDPSYASAVAAVWADGRAPLADPLARVAARLLADALDRFERPDQIARLRELAAPAEGRGASRPTTTGSGNASTTSERTLPMVGAAARPVPIHTRWLEGLVAGEPVTPAEWTGRSSVRDAREAGARFRHDPDGAWAEWRRLLSRPGRDGGSAVLWDDVHDGKGCLTAELLMALAYGALGLDADAPAGRIRIAPRIPSHLTAFAASGLCVGACSLRMDYEQSARWHRFRLTPEVASVPPLAVFEAAVPGSVARIRVDGRRAELDVKPAGRWTIVPIQLPVDGVRSIEIEAG